MRVDIDACVNFPCDPNAVCEDVAAPALDAADGRTCTCNSGYYADGDSCVGNICRKFDVMCVHWFCL